MWFTGPDTGRDYFDEDWQNNEPKKRHWFFWFVFLAVVLALACLVL